MKWDYRPTIDEIESINPGPCPYECVYFVQGGKGDFSAVVEWTDSRLKVVSWTPSTGKAGPNSAWGIMAKMAGNEECITIPDIIYTDRFERTAFRKK